MTDVQRQDAFPAQLVGDEAAPAVCRPSHRPRPSGGSWGRSSPGPLCLRGLCPGNDCGCTARSCRSGRRDGATFDRRGTHRRGSVPRGSARPRPSRGGGSGSVPGRSPAGSAAPVRVLLALQTGGPVQPFFQGRVVGAGVDSTHRWVTPLFRSTLGLSEGCRAGFQSGTTPSPISHNASRWAGRRPSPRDVRCRSGLVRAGPSGKTRGGSIRGPRRTVISCHCSGGGKHDIEQGAGGLIDDRQPTGETTVPKLGFLDGVDLPDLVERVARGEGGVRDFLGRPGRWTLAARKASWRVRAAGRSIQGDPEFTGQFDANHLGAPVGVESLHVAGSGDDRVVGGATAAELIPRLQAVETALLEGPPDLPDRVVRHAEFEGDLGEFRPSRRRRTIS